MRKGKFSCPLCQKALTEREYLAITGRWEKLQELEAEFQKRLRTEVDRARRGERQKVSHQMIVKDRKIVTLIGQLKNLKEQSERGLTPQLEGLLYEKELAKQLSQRFRHDRVVPAGKGGDVIHHVYLDGSRVGTIVYECKKVAQLKRAHVEQARRALVQRTADFAVLVTTARAGNTFGFWFERGVLLIHPAGALALVAWLRDTLIELAKARMPKDARERAVREILAFLSSPEFRNSVQDAIRRAEDLGQELRKEVQSHKRTWLRRFDHYQAIWLDARSVASGVARVTERNPLPAGGQKCLPHGGKGKRAYPLEKSALFQTN